MGWDWMVASTEMKSVAAGASKGLTKSSQEAVESFPPGANRYLGLDN
jgi:hypothetical protein